MKKVIFLCIMLFSSLTIASPIYVGDVEYGYSAISITSADGLIGNVSDVVNVGESNETMIDTENNSMTIARPTIGALQTGIGLVSGQLVNLHRTGRALPLEVGWRTLNIGKFDIK